MDNLVDELLLYTETEFLDENSDDYVQKRIKLAATIRKRVNEVANEKDGVICQKNAVICQKNAVICEKNAVIYEQKYLIAKLKEELDAKNNNNN
jgi:hypothetical protein